MIEKTIPSIKTGQIKRFEATCRRKGINTLLIYEYYVYTIYNDSNNNSNNKRFLLVKP